MAKEHRQEQRERPITENFCMDKKCAFFGKHAQQGVCFSGEANLIDLAKLEREEKQLGDELKSMWKQAKGDKDVYIKTLEAYYLCAMLNWSGTLDEVIQLRKREALSKLRKKRK